MTGTLVDLPMFRVRVDPSTSNGLRQVSDIMTDKIYTVKKTKAGDAIGHLDDGAIAELDGKLGLVPGLD